MNQAEFVFLRRHRLRMAAHFGAACLVSVMLARPALGQMPSPEACGSISNGDNGPFDFRNERRDLLVLAERNHFTPKVENLFSGQSRYDVGGDLDFVLRAFPNHPRALRAVMRWGEKLGTLQPSDLPRSVECYFERALRFRPDDNVVRMLYSVFLTRNQRLAEALRQLDHVAANAGNSALTHFNAGLLYFETRQYDKALAHAHAALTLGLQRVELREQLKSVGKWVEPSDSGEPPAAPDSLRP